MLATLRISAGRTHVSNGNVVPRFKLSRQHLPYNIINGVLEPSIDDDRVDMVCSQFGRTHSRKQETSMIEIEVDATDIHGAVQYIRKIYKRIYKVTPVIAYREGTIMYFGISSWTVESDATEILKINQLLTLCRLVHKCIGKYPTAAPCLVMNLLPQMPPPSSASPALAWLHGYFTSVLENLIIEDK